MNINYIKADPWCLIEQGFDPKHVEPSESLFSLGNGAMGQRANFEEQYSGATFEGSYIAGVYYPDKTRVGWWKNGYPEYFAKVLNAPNWIGIDVFVDGQPLDLNNFEVLDFQRVLNMKTGLYQRDFKVKLPTGVIISVTARRFLSFKTPELGAIDYQITLLENPDSVSARAENESKASVEITVKPYIDAGIKNRDSNWDDPFWAVTDLSQDDASAFILAHTLKTEFATCTYMASQVTHNGRNIDLATQTHGDKRIESCATVSLGLGESIIVNKFGGYTVDLYHLKSELIAAAKAHISRAKEQGFEALLKEQEEAWSQIWQSADITIEGDIPAQQAIRFNIFQLNQTYSGQDARLNIGPKGFTGEKYGGSTYWDTEAYCLPFYMATKNQEVARNLLTYRYKQLDKAIENAAKLGFHSGAALYPMVTMNGEECHNEWEITFEEIHRNGAIAFAIFNYERYTQDRTYLPEMGLEVLIGIARFWAQRASLSPAKGQYVILGVTGPNEYENNVNNNWYTNYMATWCLKYTAKMARRTQEQSPKDYDRIVSKTNLGEQELTLWQAIAADMYYPYHQDLDIYLQQDGFLDKDLTPVDQIPKRQRPINQHWSWDRILRSPYIKQADVLQGFYFFEEDFDRESLARHFDFYEPLTVHESSLSPCVHSILAAKLDKMDQAYAFYLRTARLDLDDYNHEVHEGCHITSMAGTWMSIVEGFGGMRVIDGTLSFDPKLPEAWQAFTFKINFRERVLKVNVGRDKTTIIREQGPELRVKLSGTEIDV
ncbi:family 65 glycosyl hydrolase domain-containing protein [Flavobacteriaceae bacterium]|nr:family 65 glycosyl hydrolase domain-containing protein [Flavobacteriaceae bacterium]